MKVKECNINDEFVPVSPDENAFDIAEKISGFKFAIVTDKKKPVGIITPRDLVDRVLTKKKDPEKTLAKDIMTSPVMTASLDDDVKDVSKIMLKNNYLSIPLVDKNEELKGIITLYDVLAKLKKG